MKLLRFLLFPFSVCYGIISRFRNFLFDKQLLLHSVKTPMKSICVGNLTVGGTGKTPHVEFLIESLTSKYAITTLSRGYGRKTKGYLVANEDASAGKIGDEPFQIYEKYKDCVNVCVGEKRVEAIDEITTDFPDTSLLLLDDAYQHRYVEANCNILLTDYQRLFYKDYMLPTGDLREVRSGADRADIIVVTKCDETISESEQNIIKSNIRRYNSRVKVYFSYISYGELVMINELNDYNNYISVSGIAQNDIFHAYCKDEFSALNSFSFSDHKAYTENDFTDIVAYCEKHKATMLVTEKDYVKLQDPIIKKFLSRISWGYVPIKVNFVPTKEISFIDEVIRYI